VGDGSYFGNDDNGPNTPASGGDNVAGCNDMKAAVGTAYAEQERMGCFACCNNNQQAPRSMHEGGVNTCFADGSVHWISDYIDIAGNYNASPPVLSVWDRLIVSADGQPVPGNAY